MTNKSDRIRDKAPEPNSVSHEIRKARNLILGLLLLGGLIGLRHLNAVPYRLKVYDENNRIETVVDWLGSYYRPIKEGEDVGGGVHFKSLKDAEEAFERYEPPPNVPTVSAQAADTGGPFTVIDVMRWVLKRSGIDDRAYSDDQIKALTDDQLRALRVLPSNKPLPLYNGTGTK